MKNKIDKLKKLYEHTEKEVREYMLEDLFSEDKQKKIKIDMDYKRNYIWDYNEASNLVETVILKAIIPPFIAMEDKDGLTIIDGKQRYKSLCDFYHNRFSLKKNGLNKLKALSGRKYSDLPRNARIIIGEAKVQVLVFKVDELYMTQDEKDFLQRDIYRRFNYGKTQLKEHEVERGKYLYDGLTQEFISFFEENEEIYEQCVNILLPRTRRLMTDNRDKISLLMLTIREILVTPYIPILGQKTIKNGSMMINRYYETFFGKLSNTEQKDILIEFQRILKYLVQIKKKLQTDNHELQDNVMLYKVIYWLLSILYKTHSDEFYYFNTDRLCHYVENGGEIYFENYNSITRDSVINRYEFLANYIQKELGLSINDYLEGLKENVEKVNYEPKEDICPDEDWDGVEADKQLTFYPEKVHISQIIKHIKDDRFVIQPEYQRAEIKSRVKASKMLESIMLGIKLPPIYIYHIVPKNGLSRDIVLDGQQRLISLLSFR